tara:strand:- start:460 stop:741 length:282 start_codon:yes stop_codon:yes gene_type:complete
MELDKLSDYEKFILMSEGKRVQANIATFQEFKELLKALELCGKGDSSTFLWRDEIREKPVNRHDANKMIEDFKKAKWNKLFVNVARQLGLEFR